MSHSTLRARLRSETRAAHDAVDAEFSRFDLGCLDGLGGFLRAQCDALSAMHDACGADATRDAISAARDRIRADLCRIGAEGDAVGMQLATGDTDALSYLWEGSRLGTRLIAREFAEAWAGRVAPDIAYLSEAVETGTWRALCQRLDGLSAVGPAADVTVSATIEWFDVFAAAARYHARGKLAHAG